MHESEKENEVVQSCPTLRDPMDCSLPGSSVHGISQAREYLIFLVITLTEQLRNLWFQQKKSPVK